LGKNNGVDMGRKTQPSVTSGGVGVTREVTNIAGVSVTVGGSIDISPIDLGINYDSSENAISVATGAELPGGLLGASGGVTIDLDTGEVTGGSVGAEGLGLGVNISASKNHGIGVEFTVQIPFTPIEISLGFGFPPKKPTPTVPTVPTVPGIDKSKNIGISVREPFTLSPDCIYFVPVVTHQWQRQYRNYNAISHQFRTGDPILIGQGIASIKKILNCGFGTSTLYPRGWGCDVEFSNGGKLEIWDPNPGVEGSSMTDYRSQTGHIIASGRSLQERWFPYWQALEATTGWSIYVYLHPLYGNCATPPTSSFPPTLIFEYSPFPNPPPRKQNMNECCREAIKLAREIYKRLGIAKFPGQLPATIVQEVPKLGEQPAEPQQVPIEDFVDLLNWQFERDDERWGQWEIQIDIKDSDITQEGDQKKSVKFPNLAESIAEMEGQMLSMQANIQALVALCVRTLTEAGMGRQEAIKGYLASMAIAKYMAFPYKEFDVEIPSTYTPGATSIDKLIIESIVHTKGIDYENKETLRDSILDLLGAAAIVRAVHWRQVDPKKDVKKQILSQLRVSADLSEKITNVKAVVADGDTPPKKESWEDKLDQFENGFGFSTGIENANTPYGRDRERRPRIRQIGDNIAQAGKDE
jgi:hypothetical protein